MTFNPQPFRGRPQLDNIIAAKTQHLNERKGRTPLEAIRALAEMQERPLPILTTVTRRKRPLIIVQLVQSLSETGNLADAYDPVSQALSAVGFGADGVALFTDEILYDYGLDDLTLISRAISVPSICQDYVLDEYHVVEARTAGAAAVVLSSAVLEPNQIRNLVSVTQRNRMTPIVTVHDEEQLRHAVSLSPQVVGIGNRDPNTHKLDLENARRLRPHIPNHIRAMTMTGIEALTDVVALATLKLDAIMIRHSLMRQPDAERQIKALLNPTTEIKKLAQDEPPPPG